MKRRSTIVVTGLVALAASAFAQSQTPEPRKAPAAMSVEDIGACMRANIVDRGSMRDFEVASTDREGKVSSFKAKLFWKPTADTDETRMVLQVVAPETHKGTSYLVVSPDKGEELAYVYLPALDRVQPVSGGNMSQPLWGTDFTIAEVKQVQGLFQQGDTKRLADEKVFDRDAFVVDTVTDLGQTGYTHVTSYVDQETCTLLKSELFARGDGPRKVLEASMSTLLEVEPWWLMLGYKMRNLESGTQTDLKLSDLFLLEVLPHHLFTPEGFFKPQI